ncbi:DnaJ-domain-containing protein [Hypoxylon sp. NC0597]|nr:DnaJ-domain-containing protein [Hypoxylon sp. NC0597]
MSSLPPDPYKILGVSKDVQLSEIRSAYKKLVLKCHPDKIQDPKLKEEKQKEFQQVQQAYELLSNEAERAKYDDKVRLEELRRDRGMTSTSTSSPRASKRHETKYYDVREAEPRPSTFSSSSPHNVYGHTPPSRSWDDEIYSRRYQEEKPRYARKAASYEYDREKIRKEDDRRRRDEEKEWNREKERAKEREREIREMERKEREAIKERERREEKEAAKKEKDRREKERKEDKKRTEKDRRKESDEKHRRHKSPYIEIHPEDREEVIYMTTSSSKTDKKKSSSSRKYEEAPAPPPPRETSRPPPTTDRERKNEETLESAIRYLSRSGGNPPALNRAQTYHPEYTVRHITPIAVPTPPPAAAAVFSPPPMANPRDAPVEEDIRRSSARPRRMSHDTPRSSEKKSSHKKSGSSKEAIIVDASPSARIVPSFQKSHSIPIPIPSDPHRAPLGRSNTDGYSRQHPIPGLERASTWMGDSDLGRDRNRSRHVPIYPEDSSEDDHDHRHRRGRRTQSPEPMTTQRRYTVQDKKAVPIQESYFEGSPPRSSKKTSYPIPNSSARRTDPRSAYYAHDDHDDDSGAYFPSNIKFAPTYAADEIKFSSVQHSLRGEELGLYA